MNKKRKPLELYVHIPFCIRKCAYCDFVSGPGTKAMQKEYEEPLLAEIDAAEEAAEMTKSPVMIWVNIVLGLACIVLGGQLAVNGATGIARMFGLSETLIGLTIVAMGTSLPELVTSIVAARKGQNDIAMGNVIGSNLFNIFLILGVSSVITPIPVQATSIVDCLFLIAISAVFYLPARKGKLGRVPGIAMVATYAVYTVYLIMR